MITINNRVIILTAAGGTFFLDSTPEANGCRIGGTATLVAGVAITAQNTPPENTVFVSYFTGNINLNGNTFFYFGQQIPQNLLTREGYFIAYFDGSDYKVAIATNMAQSGEFLNGVSIMAGTIQNAAIANDTIENAKVANDTLTAAKLAASEKLEVVTLNGSFETGEQGAYRVYFPYKCEMVSTRARVELALSGTDNGTITFANSVGNTGAGLLTIPLSSAFGTEQVATFIAPNNEVAAGSYVQATFAKTTAGGKVSLSIVVRRVV